MAWVDDRIWAHPKIVGLPSAQHRWVVVAAWCYSNGFGTAGDLSRGQQRAIGATPKIRADLIAAELWEDAGGGSIHIHDWYEHNGQREERRELAKKLDRLRKDLFRAPELRAEVRERDGDQCRYCGRTVNFSDRKGDLGGTYDFVNPGGVEKAALTAENVVVCCRSCHARKAGKTLDEARITLLPVPLQIKADQGQRSRSGVDPIKAESRPDLDLSSRTPARVIAGGRLMTGEGVTEELEPKAVTSTQHAGGQAAASNGLGSHDEEDEEAAAEAWALVDRTASQLRSP